MLGYTCSGISVRADQMGEHFDRVQGQERYVEVLRSAAFAQKIWTLVDLDIGLGYSR